MMLPGDAGRNSKHPAPIQGIPRYGWRFDSRIPHLPHPGGFLGAGGVLICALHQIERLRASVGQFVARQRFRTHPAAQRFVFVERPYDAHCVVLKQKNLYLKLLIKQKYLVFDDLIVVGHCLIIPYIHYVLPSLRQIL